MAKVIVVMPAYNAQKTLEKTYQDLRGELYDIDELEGLTIEEILDLLRLPQKK